MNREQALKIAIECIHKEAHKFAFDAISYPIYKAPSMERGYKKYKRFMDAIKILEAMQSQKELL